MTQLELRDAAKAALGEGSVLPISETWSHSWTEDYDVNPPDLVIPTGDTTRGWPTTLMVFYLPDFTYVDPGGAYGDPWRFVGRVSREVILAEYLTGVVENEEE